jgi:hypothetical protein
MHIAKARVFFMSVFYGKKYWGCRCSAHRNQFNSRLIDAARAAAGLDKMKLKAAYHK